MKMNMVDTLSLATLFYSSEPAKKQINQVLLKMGINAYSLSLAAYLCFER